MEYRQARNVRRVLVEQLSNLVTIPPNAGIPIQLEPSVALPNGKKPSPASIQEHKISDTTNPGAVTQPAAGKSGNSLKLILGLSDIVFLLIIAAAMFFVCRSKAARTIGPWKTGLSGQL